MLRVAQQRESNTTPTYSPLSASWHIINNPEEFTAGIHLAARLGLDLNNLQVGHCLNGDAVATIVKDDPGLRKLRKCAISTLHGRRQPRTLQDSAMLANCTKAGRESPLGEKVPLCL